MVQVEKQFSLCSIIGTDYSAIIYTKDLNNLDYFGADSRRGMEHISKPAKRNLLRTARRTGKLQVEPSLLDLL